jgi:hypothetical protein
MERAHPEVLPQNPGGVPIFLLGFTQGCSLFQTVGFM